MSVFPVPLEASAPTASVASGSPRFLRRLLHRPLALACLAFLGAITAIAIFAPVVLPEVADENAGDLLGVRQGPSWAHLLGTDTLGRDVLDRLLVGTQVTLIGVAEALLVALAIGVPLGLAAGYFGGRLDRAVGWLADLVFSMPGIIIILVVLSVFPKSMTAAMTTFGVIAAPGLMRVVRSAALPVREELYVAAAQVSGLSHPYIISRHVLPRIAGTVIVQASLIAAAALLVQTGLAFLSLIVAEPAPSWGGMVADGMNVILLQSWLIWPPGIAIALTVLALGLFGDVVRDATTESWSATPVRPKRRPSATRRAEVPVALAGATGAGHDSLLSIEHLSIAFPSPAGTVTVVADVSFDIRPGEVVGVVGESGCGKTVTAMSIFGLLPGDGDIQAGRILFEGRDLAALPESELRSVRGREIALISQEPMVSLNPAYRVGWQLAQSLRQHHGVSRSAARSGAVELLRSVHLPEPAAVARRYPHELSGGMAQRVAIARALAGEPKLLIADEPTTALDVTVQAEILDLLREIQQARQMSILLVTHDWGVVADFCERVVVMYAGQVVERASLAPIFREPLHPYTEALFASNPHHAADTELLRTIPGGVPRPGAWPAGCHFQPRCHYATTACSTSRTIPLERPVDGRETRCIHSDRLRVSL